MPTNGQSSEQASENSYKGSSQTISSVAAWDLPTRLFHWTLVFLVLAAWFSYEFSEELGDPVLKYHRWAGLLVLTLLVWRLLWGVFGSSTAQFRNFIPAPTKVHSYASDMLQGRESKFLSHNPVGALMIIALMTLLLCQAVLGLFSVEHNDLTAGPLYRFLPEDGQKLATSWHDFLFENVLLILIPIHIAANAFYAIFRREPLIKAMITGRKPAQTYEDANEAQIASRPLLRATVLLAVSAIIVFGGIWAVGGKFLQMRLW